MAHWAFVGNCFVVHLRYCGSYMVENLFGILKRNYFCLFRSLRFWALPALAVFFQLFLFFFISLELTILHQNNHINTYKSYKTNINILIYSIHILNSSLDLNYNIKQLLSLFIPTLSPFFTNIFCFLNFKLFKSRILNL